MYFYSRMDSDHATTADGGPEGEVYQVQARSLRQLQPVFDEVQGWMEFLDYPYRDVFAVLLAFQEAAGNAFRHGNRGDPGKHVEVTYHVSSSEVLLAVEDQGEGFDPDQVPDPLIRDNLERPGGRGLFLMRAYMSWVAFNPKGNCVTLCRRRSAS
jgi:serine/threonine-protein kinase RsbW